MRGICADFRGSRSKWTVHLFEALTPAVGDGRGDAVLVVRRHAHATLFEASMKRVPNRRPCVLKALYGKIKSKTSRAGADASRLVARVCVVLIDPGAWQSVWAASGAGGVGGGLLLETLAVFTGTVTTGVAVDRVVRDVGAVEERAELCSLLSFEEAIETSDTGAAFSHKRRSHPIRATGARGMRGTVARAWLASNETKDGALHSIETLHGNTGIVGLRVLQSATRDFSCESCLDLNSALHVALGHSAAEAANDRRRADPSFAAHRCILIASRTYELLRDIEPLCFEELRTSHARRAIRLMGTLLQAEAELTRDRRRSRRAQSAVSAKHDSYEERIRRSVPSHLRRMLGQVVGLLRLLLCPTSEVATMQATPVCRAPCGPHGATARLHSDAIVRTTLLSLLPDNRRPSVPAYWEARRSHHDATLREWTQQSDAVIWVAFCRRHSLDPFFLKRRDDEYLVALEGVCRATDQPIAAAVCDDRLECLLAELQSRCRKSDADFEREIYSRYGRLLRPISGKLPRLEDLNTDDGRAWMAVVASWWLCRFEFATSKIGDDVAEESDVQATWRLADDLWAAHVARRGGSGATTAVEILRWFNVGCLAVGSKVQRCLSRCRGSPSSHLSPLSSSLQSHVGVIARLWTLRT